MAAPSSSAAASSALLRRPPPLLHSFHLHSSCFLPSSSSAAATVSISASHSLTPHLPISSRCRRRLRVVSEEEVQAVVEADEAEEEQVVVAEDDEEGVAGEVGPPEEVRSRARPCELYICNLPRSCDIPQLLDVFKPFGTVVSVEVSRDPETGISRGCGFVTMSSIPEAKAAITSLDGSDFSGREISVKFSVEMVSGRKNLEALNTAPKRDMVFGSPHKVYVGNLAWSVRPEDLREHFSQFGNVVSTRVLHDRKGGRNRVYGFVSFSSADELKAAMETSGSVFHGRILLVREVVNREEYDDLTISPCGCASCSDWTGYGGAPFCLRCLAYWAYCDLHQLLLMRSMWQIELLHVIARDIICLPVTIRIYVEMHFRANSMDYSCDNTLMVITY